MCLSLERGEGNARRFPAIDYQPVFRVEMMMTANHDLRLAICHVFILAFPFVARFEVKLAIATAYETKRPKVIAFRGTVFNIETKVTRCHNRNVVTCRPCPRCTSGCRCHG